MKHVDCAHTGKIESGIIRKVVLNKLLYDNFTDKTGSTTKVRLIDIHMAFKPGSPRLICLDVKWRSTFEEERPSDK